MITAFMQMGLFCWFILSLFLVYNDSTLGFYLKIVGEFINIFCLGYIASNMFNQNSGILYFMMGTILLGWYIYFTPQDFHNTGYGPIEKFTYVAIDISMIIYLISSMTIALFTQYVNRFSLVEQAHQFQTLNFSWF